MREPLAAPLAEAFAGDGSAVAEFGRQGLYKSGAAEIAVKKLVSQFRHIGEKAAALYKELVVGSGAGDVEIIAPAPVKFSIHPVQSKGYDGQNVGPEGAFFPSGVDFRGGHILYIVRKADGDIFRIAAGSTQVYGDLLGYVRNNSGHGFLLQILGRRVVEHILVPPVWQFGQGYHFQVLNSGDPRKNLDIPGGNLLKAAFPSVDS